jgi:predicted Zn-dependent protease
MRPARDSFDAAVAALEAAIKPGEIYLATFAGEDSDFVRLNHDRYRQAGHVSQRSLSIDLLHDGKHALATCNLGGDASDDAARITGFVADLRGQLSSLSVDPHLLYSTSADSVVREEQSRLPNAADAVARLVALGEGLDLVGIWASGSVYAGFASSFGQRSWHSVATFNADWSCYLQADRAVKCAYAGTDFDERVLADKLADARRSLTALARPQATIAAGAHRAYFAPLAARDLVGMLSWGGFSCKALRTKSSPLLRLSLGAARMHDSVTLREDRSAGLAPVFTSEGFRAADQITLIDHGLLGEPLISPRSAKEFSLTPNSGEESPDALHMDAGSLPTAEVVEKIGNGLWINNIWYCNYSDPNACRITGMTRFACFKIEGGEVVAPLPVMRFDDSLYDLLGDRLLDITAERECLLSASTYGGRSLNSATFPGILVEGLKLTL